MDRTRNQDSMMRIWMIFRKLNRLQKLKVLARLQKETREERWENLTEKISRRFRNNPISDEDITQIVDEVRQERYERQGETPDLSRPTRRAHRSAPPAQI